jgi:hypothetical protein
MKYIDPEPEEGENNDDSGWDFIPANEHDYIVKGGDDASYRPLHNDDDDQIRN